MLRPFGASSVESTPPVKIGVTIPNIELGNDTVEIRDFVQAAEDLGFDHLMNYDHVLGADVSVRPDWRPHMGKPAQYTVDDAFHEPFVLYGFIAAVTRRIGLATGVMVLPQRQTVLAAKQAAEVDILSGGRLRLGIGSGWNTVEYEALGVDFRTRGKKMEEQIELMRLLWTQRVVNYHGEFHTVEAAGLNPLPIQRPIPIWLGGYADVVLKRVARTGQGWYVPSRLQEHEIAEKLQVLFDAGKEAGRNPRSIGVEGIVRMWGREPEECVKSLEMWRRLGATAICFNTEADSYAERLGVTHVGLESRRRRGPFTMSERIDVLRRFKEALGKNASA